MNERIKKLALQAGYKPLGTFADELMEIYNEKFAELIVRECIEWCNAHATINGTAQQVRDSIKQHFGVEE